MKKRTMNIVAVILLLLTTSACGGKRPIGQADLAPKGAVELATAWTGSAAIIKAGGLYKEGEYKTFAHKGLEYRYLAAHLDSKKKIKAELHKFVTKKKAKRFMKDNGILKHKGKLASPVAEEAPGLLLQWEIATARELKSKKDRKTFEITVPIGDTRTAETIIVSYDYVKKSGWRIDKFNE
ncbi:IseA DL-endopeptidase inhibitor family protein [Sporosarcina luteola]|uniref:IseA DL-endopeptidase inhibitor family protein n=1 Tax=Sporosarcina luteola TaxID=582850 RepID=UPI00203F019A|nr:IseA DL-endopeptidase inhibitor family protein [Sporosarcina luteola]MCM3708940.1 IseA DL-endopeptidase inhibitor family protein [Sporosarcina luteola]